MVRNALLLTIALVSSSADADQIFTWTDEEGVLHYTNDASQVPSNDKAKKHSGPALNEMTGAGDRDSSGAEDPATISKADAKEKRWRRRFNQAHARIKALASNVSEDQARLQVSGLPIFYRGKQYTNGKDTFVIADPDFIETKRRLTQNERLLKQAKVALENLEREASSQAIPREWRVP